MPLSGSLGGPRWGCRPRSAAAAAQISFHSRSPRHRPMKSRYGTVPVAVALARQLRFNEHARPACETASTRPATPFLSASDQLTVVGQKQGRQAATDDRSIVGLPPCRSPRNGGIARTEEEELAALCAEDRENRRSLGTRIKEFSRRDFNLVCNGLRYRDTRHLATRLVALHARDSQRSSRDFPGGLLVQLSKDKGIDNTLLLLLTYQKPDFNNVFEPERILEIAARMHARPTQLTTRWMN